MKLIRISSTLLLFASYVAHGQSLGKEIKSLEQKTQTTESSSSSTTTAAPATTVSDEYKAQVSKLESSLLATKASLSKKDQVSSTKSAASASSVLGSLASNATSSSLTGVDFKGMQTDLSQLQTTIKAKNYTGAQTALTSFFSKFAALKSLVGL